MSTSDFFTKQTLKDIKSIFPLLPDKIISFAYYQLGDKKITIDYLRQKYENFHNTNQSTKIEEKHKKESLIKDNIEIPLFNEYGLDFNPVNENAKIQKSGILDTSKYINQSDYYNNPAGTYSKI